ncbi:MAG: HesA/MoeB/ThiF family protein [Bacteroidota bacterium]
MKEFSKEQFFKRQTTLNEFGEEKQQKLQDAEIVIVGCGGLGCVAAVYLAASGVGNIKLIDYDVVDVSNLHRQVFYKRDDIGKLKAEVLADHIKSISPFVNVSTSNKPITKSNIFSEIDDFDVVLDCTDSLPTKYLLNDYCVMTDHILVYGSLYKHDGYVATFNIPEGLHNSANLRTAFPKMPEEAVPNCSEVGTLNPIVGIIGLMQANEAIKIITGIGKPLKDQILIYNSLDNSQLKMKLKVDIACDNIGKRGILRTFKNEDYLDANCEIHDENLLISASELKQKFGSRDFHIISVAEDLNTKIPFEVSEKIPLSEFKVDNYKVHSEKEYITVCEKGILSYVAAKDLKDKYPDLKIFSLKKGTENY